MSKLKNRDNMNGVAYCRYSSDNQREESIDAQIRAIKEYAQRNNINIVKVYVDEAKSATNANRPEFLKMISDSKLGIFDIVIVHKLDRFSRDRYDSLFFKRKLSENGVKLLSVLENLDDSPESIILESVLGGMAEFYSANLAREVMKGMKETALQCKHTGGKPPLGYKVNADKTYSIDKAKAQIIKIIFNMYAMGKGYGEILDKLNSDGYKTQTGRSFGKNSLHGILKNEKYRGVYIYNRTASKVAGKRNHNKSKDKDKIIRIDGGMPRIIDDKTWGRVIERMENNKRGSNSAKETYLLSGIIYCGKCGGAMNGKRRYAGRNKTLYISYECSTKKRTKECNAKEINRDYAEGTVIDYLEKKLFSDSGLEKMADKIIVYSKKQSDKVNKEVKEFTSELTGVETEINNIVEAIAKGMFHESMKEKMDILEERKSALKIKLEGAKIETDKYSPTRENIIKYLARNRGIKNKSLDEQKEIIQSYVKKVTVFENNIDVEIVVTFNGGGEGS